MSENIYVYEFEVHCTECSHNFISHWTAPDESCMKCPKCGLCILTIKQIYGYVYVLSNPKIPSLVKIGFTTRSVENRVSELNSSSGVPMPFVIESFFTSTEPHTDEKKIHERLEGYRDSKDREFFNVTPEKALFLITKILGRNACYLKNRITLGGGQSDIEEIQHNEIGDGITAYKFKCNSCGKLFYEERKELNQIFCPYCSTFVK